MTQEEMTKVVDTHIEAYRAKELSSFLDNFDESIEIYLNNENIPWMKGIVQIRAYYERLFQESPDLSISIKQRMVTGEFIIDHEEIRGARGTEVLKTLRVYELKNKKIAKARYYI